MPDRRGSGDQALEEAARNAQSFRRSGTDLERKANTSVNVAADEYDIWGDFDDAERQALGLKLTQNAAGIEFANGQVIGYDLTAMLRLRVFRVYSQNFMGPYVLCNALFILLMSILVTGACVWVHGYNNMFDRGSPITGTILNFDGYFKGFSGFFFAYFVFNCLGGYNNIKNNQLGNLLGAGGVLCFLNVQYFPDTKEGSPDMIFKETVARYVMAAYALTCYSAIGNDPKKSVAKCILTGYLTKEEADALALIGYNATAPLLWLIPLYEARIPNLGDNHCKVPDLILQMRNGVGGVLTSVSTFGQLPLPLVHLMSALIKMQLFLDALKCGVNNAEFILAKEGTLGTPGLNVALECVMLLVNAIFYTGLFEFVLQISNPFGDDWIDLPSAHMQAGYRAFLEFFVNGKDDSTFDPGKNIKIGK